MKNIFKIGAIVILMCLVSFGASAQKKQKFGHINSQELLQAMPGVDSVLNIISEYAKTLESQLSGMEAELNNKAQEYQANVDKMTDLIKQTKLQELQDIQNRIQNFESSAQEDLSKKNAELLQPIVDKAKAAIDKVAVANGYTYVFESGAISESGATMLLFADPTDDLMPLVKAELGITK